MLVVAFPAFSDSHLNPYGSLLYTHVQAQGQPIVEFGWRRVVKLQLPDILHVHWPERQILAPGWRPKKLAEFVLFRIYLRAIRLRGGKVVWTAHNSFGHDKPRTRLNRFLWRRFLSALDGVIYLSSDSRKQINADYPVLTRKHTAVIRHGDYIGWLRKVTASGRCDSPSRESLGIPAHSQVLLSFGLIRPYKGIDLLVEEFKLVDSDVHLVIAGYTSNEALRNRILQLSRDHPNIHCLLRWMKDDELTALLQLSDAVVLPYSEVTNSGAALLALSAQRRVLGPCQGSLPELQRLAGPGWVRLYDGRISRSHLEEALTWLDTARGPLNMEPFSWEEIATHTLGFYRTLVVPDRG
jgi:glycosyltransferase involved in cell wall biosynthesis